MGFSVSPRSGAFASSRKPPLIPAKRRVKRLAPLGPADERRIDKATDAIEDDALRAALARLGKNILAEKRTAGRKDGKGN